MSEETLPGLLNAAPFGYAYHELIYDENGIVSGYRYVDINPEYEKITGLKASEILGKTIGSTAAGQADTDPGRLQLFGRIAAGRGNESFEYYSEPVGRWYQVQLFSPMRGYVSAFFIDITEKRRAGELMLQAGKSRTEIFLSTSLAIAAAYDLKSLLQAVADNAASLLNLESSALYMLSGNSTIRLAATRPPLPADFPEEFRIAHLAEHPHLQKALSTGNAVVLEDSAAATLTAGEMEVVRIRNLRSVLYQPVRLRHETIGILIVASVGDIHDFTGEEILMLRGFTDYSAQVIDNVRNHESVRKYATDLEQEIDERKRTEVMLKESELRYRTLFENMNAGFVLFEVTVDREGSPEDLIILEGNKGFEAATGLKIGEVTGTRLSTVLPSITGDSENWVKTYGEVALTGQPKLFMQGSESLGSYYSIAAFQTAPRHCAVTFIDVTESKKAELALLDSNEKLRQFYDANIVGIIIATPSGKIVEANDYYLELIGYTRKEFEEGLVDWRSITPPEWLAVDEEAIIELREKGRCTPYEKEYVRRDGSRVSVYLSDAMLAGPEEQIAAFALDITDRKKAEAALRLERDFSDKSINSLPGIFYCYDKDLRFNRWNRNFELVSGYSAEEILNMSPLDFCSDRDKELLAERIGEVFIKGESSVEADFVSKDGKHTPYYFTGVSMEISGSKLLVGVGLDISKLKMALGKMEEQLRELQQWHDLMLDREDRVLGLKKEVNDLLVKAGLAPKYGLDYNRIEE